MAVIYLRHPLHGEKVACGDGEAAADRANGWVDFDPSVKPEPAVAEVIPEPVAVVPDFFNVISKGKKKP